MRDRRDPDDLTDLFGDAPQASNDDDWTLARAVWRVSEIAERMGMAVSTVRGWAEDGLLRATKTSPRGHYRVAADDLRVFLNGHAEPLRVDAPVVRAAPALRAA